ncbi:recombinase family protein [Pontibacterium sp. N1Y112]|uniref:Recombinase family protein n=1 Tax=Pontibacterium sinense TaxID=2781979 RepID=A0A8J7FCB0_9GAMM|nr:recombinase family protein [Pontibacterium sinense]MBE9397104.1 recombinase family protein [Pontibacterium sinense]
MTTFAYCRVSTLDQDTVIQEEALRKAYPDAVIRTEKASGTTTDGRPVLELLMDMISDGDKLVVWKLDRLARNMNDLTNLVQTLEDKGASLEILDQRIDTATASGKAFLQMLGVFAEFETNLRKERQLAGIAKAKAEGKYKGKQRVIDADRVKELKAKGMGATTIAKELGIGRASVYRLLN